MHIFFLALVDEEYDQLPDATIRNLISQRSFPDTPATWKSMSDFSLAEYENDGNHGHRVSGYFLATETGKFKFFGSCPTGCRLYLSDDDSCNRRSLVLEYTPPAKTRKRLAMVDFESLTQPLFRKSKLI